MISADRRDKSLHYLATTDEKVAKARAYLLGLEKTEKIIIGQQILEQKGDGGTVAEKDAKARTSAVYLEWLESYENAVADYELYRAKRHTEELVFACWQTEESSRRMAGKL